MGDFFTPPRFAPVNRVAGGEFRLGVASMAATPPPSAGTLAEVIFEVTGCGETSFDPARGIKLSNEKGVALSFNLTGGVFVNQSAAYSDYHGTGGNPAANASYADAAFVANRFVVVQRRYHV